MTISNITCPPADGAYELTKNLLAKAHSDYDVNYEEYLANHLPHGLYTLCALGGILLNLFYLLSFSLLFTSTASKSRLQEFYDMYVKRLEPLKKSNSIINSSNWSENIGNKK